jgi:hypothetical protein
MSGIQQMLTGGSYGYPNNWPVPAIGFAYEGGFFAGQIDISGTKYNLVVAPKATGEYLGKAWGPTGVTTGITSVSNGPANSAALAALGATYAAATFCEGLNIGGYTDWYLPAKNELEIMYYYLKPIVYDNNTDSGANANAVSPEPINTNYTASSPAQTSASGFKTGGANAFAGSPDYYWSSTESSSTTASSQYFVFGFQDNFTKTYLNNVRAIRRVLA